MAPTKLASILAVLALAIGCGSDDDDGDDLPTEARYVIANEVYVGMSSTTYVNVLPSLDNVSVDITKATVFEGGRATILPYNGWLFVAPPDRPVIIRYSINSKGVLVEDGEISFANYGLKFVYIDEWALTFISATKAYLLHTETGMLIVFNPTTMRLTGEIPPQQNMVRGTLYLNSSGTFVRGNRMYQTFSWTDWDTYDFPAEQYLAVTDTDTDTQIALIPETRCPALTNRIEIDESGTLYFSNWVHNVPATLIKGDPSSCALRILPGQERFDPNWVFDFRAVTEGREAAMYSYLGNGKGTLNVFHGERITWDENTDPSELASTNNWKLWNVDIAAGAGAPMDGQEWMSGGASTFHIDGRSFVLTPSLLDTTVISEIKDGRSTPSFEVPGWCYQLFKVR